MWQRLHLCHLLCVKQFLFLTHDEAKLNLRLSSFTALIRTWLHVDIRINFGTILHVVTAWGNTAVLGGLAFDNLLSLVIYWLVNYPVLINHQLDQV